MQNYLNMQKVRSKYHLFHSFIPRSWKFNFARRLFPYYRADRFSTNSFRERKKQRFLQSKYRKSWLQNSRKPRFSLRFTWTPRSKQACITINRASPENRDGKTRVIQQTESRETRYRVGHLVRSINPFHLATMRSHITVY